MADVSLLDCQPTLAEVEAILGRASMETYRSSATPKVPAQAETSSQGPEPCPACGSLEFNPHCARCVDIRQECLLLGMSA